MKMTNLNFLNNPEFIKWCSGGITEETLLTNGSSKVLKPFSNIESLWGNKLIGQEGNKQWTTLLCEGAVKELLTELGYKNITNARSLQSSFSKKKYNPDWECDDFVWEVKGRSWTTPGTAGEKILGTPLKYSEIPKLYGKPLRIITVGYQEWEAKNGFACGNLINPKERGTEELQRMLILFNKLKIEYFGFTDLLKQIEKNKK